MTLTTKILIGMNLVTLQLGVMACYYKKSQVEVRQPVVARPIETPSAPVPPPIQNSIQNAEPSYMNYSQTVAQLKQWNLEAPELTEVGTYGQSTKGESLYFLRIKNKRITAELPKVLITACIHGNEPLSSSTVMWYIGAMLKHYGEDESITELINTRDVYFVPVVSPDSYPHSRHVDGVDPNRDFPSPSRPNHDSRKPVAAIQKFFLNIKPQAVLSGHTWGRVYLTPYGDTMENCPDHDEYTRVVGEMAELSGYRNIRACDLYMGNGRLNNPPIRRSFGVSYNEYTVSIPIHGTEIDWYYRQGSFAIVMEFGTHQRIPSDEDTRVEFNKTFKAVLHFIQEAPLVKITQQ